MSATGASGQPDPAPVAEEQPPFHDFRRQPLEYSGPDADRPDAEDLEEIVIGWFGPSDLRQGGSNELWAAAQLAIDDANASGGWQGRPFRLVSRWSENPWESGATQVARMAWDDRVWAILGSLDGATTHLAEQIVAKARLPLVSPVATDESVNLAGVPWMFSVAPGDHLWAPIVAEALVGSVGSESFAMVAFTDHDSRLAADTVSHALAALDRGPSMRLDLAPEAEITKDQLERLDLGAAADVLLIAGPEDGARTLRTLRAFGFTGSVFASPQASRRRALESAGDAAVNLHVPILLGEADTPAREAFVQRYRKATGRDPDWAVLHAYDATRILIEAVRRAGPSRTGIRQALLELSPWQGITGVIEWDPTGQNKRPVTAIGTVPAHLR